MVIPVQADNYWSGEKGCCKLCYCHLLSTFTLEWLGLAGLHNSYQMDGKDSNLSAEWVQSDQKQKAKILWTKMQQEPAEATTEWSRVDTTLGSLSRDI